jgi:hypothetical protein
MRNGPPEAPRSHPRSKQFLDHARRAGRRNDRIEPSLDDLRERHQLTAFQAQQLGRSHQRQRIHIDHQGGRAPFVFLGERPDPS